MTDPDYDGQHQEQHSGYPEKIDGGEHEGLAVELVFECTQTLFRGEAEC